MLEGSEGGCCWRGERCDGGGLSIWYWTGFVIGLRRMCSGLMVLPGFGHTREEDFMWEFKRFGIIFGEVSPRTYCSMSRWRGGTYLWNQREDLGEKRRRFLIIPYCYVYTRFLNTGTSPIFFVSEVLFRSQEKKVKNETKNYLERVFYIIHKNLHILYWKRTNFYKLLLNGLLKKKQINLLFYQH